MKNTLNKILFAALILLTATGKLSAQMWIQQTTNTSEDLKAIQFIDAQIGYAAGGNGTIIKTTDGGTNWTTLSSGITETIRSICFLDQNIGWLAGDNGTIISTTDGGVNWSAPQTTGTAATLTNVKFLNANDGYFTGGGPIIKMTNDGGASWTISPPIPSGLTGTIWGLCALDANNLWVSGSSHTLNNTTNGGVNWSTPTNVFAGPPLNSTTVFEDIMFINSNEGWTVGGQGRIYHTANGTAPTPTWTVQNPGLTGNELLSVKMLNNTLGWTCGRLGTILNFDGTNWVPEASGVTQHLWQVDFVDPTTGYIAGDLGTVLKYYVNTSTAPLLLLSPNGGELFTIGTNQNIIWSVNSVANVDLEYSIDNGSNWITIATNVPASGPSSYNWTIPNNPSCQALVRILDSSNPAVGDTSDVVFYIQPQPVGKDYAVLVTATASNSPAQIALDWNTDINAQYYDVDRKLKSDLSWTNLTSLSGTTNSYIDNIVNIGEAYEYRITRTTCQLSSYGYIYAGLELPETDFRGTILLLVDQNFAAGISTELTQFELDLIGDGYKINTQIVDPTIGVAAIKNIILAEYALDPGITTVLTIGHLPAPYSGNFAPDGHAERIGAQPADGFYGDLDNNLWTDISVTTSTLGTIYTPNNPLDGIYDQNTFPSDIDLQVGRIDMDAMSGFSLSENALIQQYLTKNHDFRLKNFQPLNRAIMNTTMDQQMATTSSAAWRSYSAMFGNGIFNLTTCDTGCPIFKDSITTYSYLWAHMAGGGSDTSMQNDVFTSSQCINNPIKSVFMQMYGSYFVEWYKGGITGTQNHLLRAPLASNGTSLAIVWSGKAPYWHFHHMALGETIGYSTVLNQNNVSTYSAGMPTLQNGVHMNLMGDPTLKMHIVAPVSNITATESGSGMNLSWTASTDVNIVGYNIYRATDTYGDFVKINSGYVTSTNFTDVAPISGNSVYMVRAVKLENTTSGSYYNLSTGLMANAYSTVGLENSIEQISFSIFPNPTNNQFTIRTSSEAIGNSYQIIDMVGRIIISGTITNTITQIETTNLESGTYMIKIGDSKLEKLVVEK